MNKKNNSGHLALVPVPVNLKVITVPDLTNLMTEVSGNEYKNLF